MCIRDSYNGISGFVRFLDRLRQSDSDLQAAEAPAGEEHMVRIMSCLLYTSMLKTGVSGFSAEEISQLENYAFLWKVKGGAWREEFVRHPRGDVYKRQALLKGFKI